MSVSIIVIPIGKNISAFKILMILCFDLFFFFCDSVQKGEKLMPVSVFVYGYLDIIYHILNFYWLEYQICGINNRIECLLEQPISMRCILALVFFFCLNHRSCCDGFFSDKVSFDLRIRFLLNLASDMFYFVIFLRTWQETSLETHILTSTRGFFILLKQIFSK